MTGRTKVAPNDEDLADVELHPEDDPWYGKTALPNQLAIDKANKEREVLAARSTVINALPLLDEAKKKLYDALTTSDLWPSGFRTDEPAAKATLNTNEKWWSMTDTRALLCIRRNCALMPRVFGPLFFPTRGKEAANGKWGKLIENPHPNWNRVNDEWLITIFENKGEKFDEFAGYFDKQYRAYDLELAYAYARHKKDNPPRVAKKGVLGEMGI